MAVAVTVAGETIHADDPVLLNALETAAKKLNLSPHPVCDKKQTCTKTFYSPADLEVLVCL